MNLKKITIGFVSVTTALTLAACGGDTNEEEPIPEENIENDTGDNGGFDTDIEFEEESDEQLDEGFDEDYEEEFDEDLESDDLESDDYEF